MVRRVAVFGLLTAIVIAFSARAQFVDPFDESFKDSPRTAIKKSEKSETPDPPGKKRKLNPLQDFKTFVTLKASAEPTKIQRGQVIQVVIDGTTLPYGYTYSAVKRHKTQSGKATVLEYENPWIKPLYPIEETGGETKTKDGETSYILHDKFQLKQETYIDPSAPTGPQKIVVKVKIQVCTKKNENPRLEEFCFPPDEYTPLEIPVEISEAAALAPPSDLARRSISPKLGDNSPTQLRQFDDVGTLLIGAFIGAILMLLTPCVFPMIPITVNFFIKQSEKEHHRPVFMASVYAGTIVVLLATAVLVIGSSIISLANEPWFNLGLGAVLMLFALGLFGMFEVDLTKFAATVVYLFVAFGLSWGIKTIFPALESSNKESYIAIACIVAALPVSFVLAKIWRAVERTLGFEESAVLNFLARQESRGGVLGAVFMALTFTITSFSCTGPFLGILLAPLAGLTMPYYYLLLGALVYAVTFAAPFFVLALFPTYLKKLPKSGGWMTTIKVTMGFLEIGAALKFFANVDLFWFPGDPRLFNYDTVLCSWIALSFACGLYLFGLFRLHHDTVEDHISVPRMIFASLFIGMGFYLIPLLFNSTPQGLVMEGAVSFLPLDLKSHEGWYRDDYEDAWKQAVKEKKLIFIDFTGQNCANCRANERNAFKKANVINELKNYVCLQLFTDAVPDPEMSPSEAKRQGLKQRDWQVEMADTIANPTYVIFEPDPITPFIDGFPNGRVVYKTVGLIPSVSRFAKKLKTPE